MRLWLGFDKEKAQGHSYQKAMATNCKQIRSTMCKCCDKTHKHVTCEGIDTRVSEEYTDAMVHDVQHAFMEYCHDVDRSRCDVGLAVQHVGMFSYRGLSFDVHSF